jgi:hypothetical protein
MVIFRFEILKIVSNFKNDHQQMTMMTDDQDQVPINDNTL